MSASLHLAEDLALPIELVVQKTAILARSGAGKTNTAVVVAEEALEAAQQVVILDPPGAWWGLRASADGKRAGYPIVVLGGIHGDLPLQPTGGELIADLVVDQGLSVVLDLSEFTDGEVARFVAAFGQRLYARKNRVRDPLLLIVEEADELAPQNVRPDQTLMLHAMERLAKRGRMRGIGLLLITQRSAALNKHVLSQIEVLVAMQTTDPRDIKAIDEWIERHGDQEQRRQLLAEIASLPVGSAFVWSPAWLRVFQKTRFRRRRTFDSSATPEPGKRQVQPKSLADVDLAALRDRMAETIARHEAEDPKALRARIMALEKERDDAWRETHQHRARWAQQEAAYTELRLRFEEAAGELRAIHELGPNAAIGEDLVRQLDAYVVAIRESQEAARQSAEDLRAAADAIAAALASRQPTPATVRDTSRQVAPVRVAPRTHEMPVPVPSAPADGVTAPQQRILDALASFAALGLDVVDKSNAAVFAGQSSTSSGYANNLGRLRAMGLVDYPAGGQVALTEAGRRVATPAERIATVADLHDAWRRKLSAPQWRILEALIRRYPEAAGREWLAQVSGQSPTSSGFANNLGSLRSLGLLDYPTRGNVAATDLLFPVGLARG